MYMTFRQMHADPGRVPDAVALACSARDHLNSEHGGNYAVSINVGGDPSRFSLASPWERLGDYERVRAAIATDDRIQSIMRMAGGLLTSAQDTIAQVLKAPSGRGAYASTNTAMMHMPAVADAVPFAIEVAEFVGSRFGRDVGVLTAMTGNRAGVMWLSYADSLDQMADEGQQLETDPDYLAFFKRSESLFTPGTLEQSIWQIVP